MLAGTGSDVGKSLLVAGLCRIFLQDGYTPAPFKAQNMALNSYVTSDGLEIGRAQAVQAEAAGVECMAEMNPVLLKPIANVESQVVLNGRPLGNRTAVDYYRPELRERLRREVHAAFDRLSERFNPIVLEGAGSISELNLREGDLVNMPMAAYADAAVVLVADIDRGGVFASAYGSVMLQTPEDRRRIKGIIVNKFRGDERLFTEGRRILEEICGVPVLGVMPWLPDLRIEAEDAVVQRDSALEEGQVKIGIVRLPHIANFTDFDPLENDDRIHLSYLKRPEEAHDCRIIVLPGSKATISDLQWLHNSGFAEMVLRARKAGKTVVGICGGYQMMGKSVADPSGIEGAVREMTGLGLLDVRTVIGTEKATRRREFRFMDQQEICTGYEIHMGATHVEGSALNVLDDGTPEGCMADERCFGSYMHGIFENPGVVDFLIRPYTEKKARWSDYKAFKEAQYDKLAEEMRRHIDIESLYKILSYDD